MSKQSKGPSLEADTSLPALPTSLIELDVQGMTCAACAARIEKNLNKVDGASASVNFATEKASIRHDGHVRAEELIAVVKRTGFEASVPASPDRTSAPPQPGDGQPEDQRSVQLRALRTRVIISAVLSLPVVAMARAPALQ